jgi:hypothetical protein
MPRASDGSYTPPPGTKASTGSTIQVSQHNPFVDDVSAALSQSLSRTGQGAMQADLDMGGFALKNAANFGSANTYNGYQKLPSGVILQWGGGLHSDGSGAQPVTFPIPFPAFTLHVIVSSNASAPPLAFHGAGNDTRFGTTVFSAQSSGVAAPAGTAFRWFAIGY